MIRFFQYAEQQRLPRNITKYSACHAKWLSWLIGVAYETLSQCAEQQRLFSNITKYCACHAKWLSGLIGVTYNTLFTMRGVTKVTLQHHQILRLPRKMTLQNVAKVSPWDETSFSMSMNPSVRNPPRNRGCFSRSPAAFCIEKYKHFALRLYFQN